MQWNDWIHIAAKNVIIVVWIAACANRTTIPVIACLSNLDQAHWIRALIWLNNRPSSTWMAHFISSWSFFFSTLIGIMPYLDWGMVTVTVFSCISMLFESPWPTTGENLVMNNFYLQVITHGTWGSSPFQDESRLGRRLCVCTHYDVRVAGENSGEWSVFHSESGCQRCRRSHDHVHIFREFLANYEPLSSLQIYLAPQTFVERLNWNGARGEIIRIQHSRSSSFSYFIIGPIIGIMWFALNCVICLHKNSVTILKKVITPSTANPSRLLRANLFPLPPRKTRQNSGHQPHSRPRPPSQPLCRFVVISQNIHRNTITT